MKQKQCLEEILFRKSSTINNLSFYLRKQEKEEQLRFKARMKEIIKINTEINEIETQAKKKNRKDQPN